MMPLPNDGQVGGLYEPLSKYGQLGGLFVAQHLVALVPLHTSFPLPQKSLSCLCLVNASIQDNSPYFEVIVSVRNA